MIKIDYREKDIIRNFDLMCKKKEKNIEVSIENLALGDFIIGDEIIIERKSLSDLVSSICDGRYKEQSNRLFELKEKENKKIIYILEGDINTFHSRVKRISKDTILGCIYAFQMEKGFHVINSSNLMNTIDYLIKFTEKYHQKKKPSLEPSTAVPSLMTNFKSSQINKENISILMLSIIPGISHHTAECILKKYDNSLFLFLQDFYCDEEECLNNIVIDNQETLKNKKLPINVKNKIKEFFSET